MPSFPGSLRLATDPQSRVRADIEVNDERLVVRAGGDELGNWALSSVTFDPAPGGFRMNADGEDLILTTGDNPAFAQIVGVDAPPPLVTNSEDAEPVKKAARAVPSKGADSKRFGQLRKSSAASWVDDDTLDPLLAYVLMAAGLLVIVGAALNWGDFRLLGDDGFPWGRLFAGTGAVGAIVGAVLAWREHRRMIGAGIATGAGVVILAVLYFYAREAGLGLGYFVAMLAAVPLTIAGVIGLTPKGIAPPPDRN
jgi:hypothetical protein